MCLWTLVQVELLGGIEADVDLNSHDGDFTLIADYSGAGDEFFRETTN